jgi:hypothetical protein
MTDNERIKQVFSSSGGAIITGNLSIVEIIIELSFNYYFSFINDPT